MALTRPRVGQFNTNTTVLSDSITVLNGGSTTANADVGFLINRANGLVSNVSIYWSESLNSFVTAFTANTGSTRSNISVTSYADLVVGNITATNITNLEASVSAANLAIITANTALKNYTDSKITTEINNLINSAPGTLDTLGEIAANLANNSDTVGVILNSITNTNSNVTAANTAIALKANISEPEFSGNIFVTGNVSADKLYTTDGIYWAGNGAVVSSPAFSTIYDANGNSVTSTSNTSVVLSGTTGLDITANSTTNTVTVSFLPGIQGLSVDFGSISDAISGVSYDFGSLT